MLKLFLKCIYWYEIHMRLGSKEITYIVGHKVLNDIFWSAALNVDFATSRTFRLFLLRFYFSGLLWYSTLLTQEGSSDDASEPASLVLRRGTFELRRNNGRKQLLNEKYSSAVWVRPPFPCSLNYCNWVRTYLKRYNWNFAIVFSW